MKKTLICVVSTLFPAFAFAAPLEANAGGGALLGYTFTRYSLEAKGALDPSHNGNIQSAQTMDRFDYGGFLFVGAAYGEFALSFLGGRNSYQETLEQRLAGGAWSSLPGDPGTGSGTEMTLGFSLLGKYPFRVSHKITWFPLLGVEYRIALLEWRKPRGDMAHDRTTGELLSDLDKDGDPYPLSAWNSLAINLGAGFDYAINQRLFLRNELLFSFRLKTAYETGALETIKHRFHASDVTLKGLTGGPAFRTSLGYRFFGKK